MTTVQPTIRCRCGNAMVFARGGMCVACQERYAKAMNRTQGIFNPDRDGWNSLGGYGRWMRANTGGRA